MSALYVYALLAEGERPLGEPGTGIGGEALELVRAHGLVAAVARVEVAPAVGLGALREHDEAVQRLSAQARALLPLRFGQVLPDERALRERIERLLPRLRTALARVERCDQMTWRVYGKHESAAPARDATGAQRGPAQRVTARHATAQGASAQAGPGTRYLAQRRASLRADSEPPPALAPALERVARFVRAQRVERRAEGQLLASIYHLVRRVDRQPYDRHAGEALLGLREPRVQVSGPWPPYAFAEVWS